METVNESIYEGAQEEVVDPGFMFTVAPYDPLDAPECDPVTGAPIFPPLDDDGHYVAFEPCELDCGMDTIEVVVQRGLSWQRAAHVLRKLADRIEQNAGNLSTLANDSSGYFNSDGSLHVNGRGCGFWDPDFHTQNE